MCPRDLVDLMTAYGRGVLLVLAKLAVLRKRYVQGDMPRHEGIVK